MARVFISSTSQDLADYREAAKNAAIVAGFFPVMSEYFTAGGERRPLAECVAQVQSCEVLVVIVANYYGSRVAGTEKSYTWREVEAARARSIEVIPVFADLKFKRWMTDFARLEEADARGEDTSELHDEVVANRELLKKFREELRSGVIREEFTSEDSLWRIVEGALREWCRRHPGRCESGPVNTRQYLAYVREEAGWIDIRGLMVGSGKAQRFPIREIYIPLVTAAGRMGPRTVRLEDALWHGRLVIVGDPGSGKTTFLRRIAFELVENFAGAEEAKAAPAEAGFFGRLWEALQSVVGAGNRQEDGPLLPLFIRISELAAHIRKYAREAGCPTGAGNAAWLVHFLKVCNREKDWGLEENFFSETLRLGRAIVLLDGLDEASHARERASLSALFQDATRVWPACRFVVTTRPASYEGEAVLTGFEQATIEPLDDEGIDVFVANWCNRLFPGEEQKNLRAEHLGALRDALRAKREIRRMAQNPVMLTALAVVQWHERRLPEQRADLYESILNWLARSRPRDERESPERCLTLLQEVALEMQRYPEGRQAQVSRRWAAEQLCREFGEAEERKARERAEAFLRAEEIDSGVVVSRGEALKFWHLTFQEFLAAKAINARREEEQWELLLEKGRIYQREWKETALLFAGVLGKQGLAKVDGLFKVLLDRLNGATPAERFRALGLMGGMVRDLRPFGYEPKDTRYREGLRETHAIFDAEQCEMVPFADRLAAADALGRAGDPRLEEDNWVPIPSGEFWMGGDREGEGRRVRVEAFEMGKYPVTVAEYEKFVEAGGKAPDQWEEQREHPNRPVVHVSWDDAVAYCQWAKCRLPTEEEWDYAARGSESRKYPWGQEEPDATRANYGDGGPGHATPVGMYPRGASPFGLLDMAGNVLEWTADRYINKVRARRGGCFYYSAAFLRGLHRYRYEPVYRNGYFGFRSARDAGGALEP